MKNLNLHFQNTFLKIHFQKWKQDYRHFICIGITLISLGFGFLFPNSLPRLAETVRDLGLSIAYYFCELISPNANPISPTVLQMPSWQFTDRIWEPLQLFPFTWEEFKVLWGEYWQVIFTKENFLTYWYEIGDIMFYFSRLILVIIPLIFLLIMRLSAYKDFHCTDRNKKSASLKAFEKMMSKTIYPIISWCKGFVDFCRQNDKYHKTWFVLWLLHFNVFSIGIGFVAYYLYFSVSWDIVGNIHRC